MSPGKAVHVKSILRAGFATLVALMFAVGVASAIEYNDVIGLTEQGVSDRTIIELIVKDGRAFEMSDDELARLKTAGVSQVVIDAMLDPAVGQDWLDGPDGPSSGGGGGGGYSTSLDQTYGNGYSAGYSSGLSTALVFSFGYYYGPLASYYYSDPFYYPFWYSGYSCAYWPSYYAYCYRPAYSWCYSYPYNYYNYGSYYCHTYYDPGYYVHNGYNVQPGYGRTVWDNGPRWRDGGLPPSGAGRVDPGTGSASRTRVNGGQFANGERGATRTGAPPVVREAQTGTRGRLAGGENLDTRARSNRSVQSPRVVRSSPDEGTSSGTMRSQPTRSRSVENAPKTERAPSARTSPDVERSPRVIRSRPADRSAGDVSRSTRSDVQRNPGVQRNQDVRRSAVSYGYGDRSSRRSYGATRSTDQMIRGHGATRDRGR